MVLVIDGLEERRKKMKKRDKFVALVKEFFEFPEERGEPGEIAIYYGGGGTIADLDYFRRRIKVYDRKYYDPSFSLAQKCVEVTGCEYTLETFFED